MSHRAVSVAAELLEIAHSKGLSLTPMQVLKLVYIAHGWMLGLCSRPLISDKVEAWRYGPVIPEVYHAIKEFRDNPVQEIPGVAPAQLDEDQQAIVDQVLDIYGSHTGIELSSITHQQGTPWDRTWNGYGKNAIISNDEIETHYAMLYRRSNPQPPMEQDVAACM